MKTITLCLFAILIFSSCEKYYDDKYDEHIKFIGTFNDTLVDVEREVSDLTFDFNFTESFSFKKYVYLRFAINCDLGAKNDNCYFMNFDIQIDGVNKDVNAKNIAKAINNEDLWNKDLESSMVITDCENEICGSYVASNSSGSASFSIEADHKGDWLFLKGQIDQYPLLYSSDQGETGLTNGTFDIAVKIEN